MIEQLDNKGRQEAMARQAAALPAPFDPHVEAISNRFTTGPLEIGPTDSGPWGDCGAGVPPAHDVLQAAESGESRRDACTTNAAERLL